MTAGGCCHYRVEMQLFPKNQLPPPHRHHEKGNKYRHLPPTMAHYRQTYRHLHYFHYKPKLSLQAFYRQQQVIYHRLPAVIKKYRHVGSVVVKLCISTNYRPLDSDERVSALLAFDRPQGPLPSRESPQRCTKVQVIMMDSY